MKFKLDRVLILRRKVGTVRRPNGRVENVYQYRWRRVAPNGQIVGASTESYSSRKRARGNFYRNLQPARIEA